MANSCSSDNYQTDGNYMQTALTKIWGLIRAAHSNAAFPSPKLPQLVAVSKKKPADMIQLAYDAGHRHFGENYVQEFVEKSNSLPSDIKWHYIGAIQSNKCGLICSVPSLYIVESVHSEKIASALQKACVKYNRTDPLNVLVQVNTSGEESKSGVIPSECMTLVRYVREQCPNLRFVGLMTIGALARSTAPVSELPNTDFVTLRECRDDVTKTFGIPTEHIELSMGMSSDFEHAIDQGSSTVRVGSLIFGAR